jgi:hypothetical protein
MTSDLLQIALALLAIVLPLLIGWALVSLQGWRKRKRRSGAARHG